MANIESLAQPTAEKIAGTIVPARIAAEGGIMTKTALKYSPNASLEDAYPTELPGVIAREKLMALAAQEMAEWHAKMPKSKAMYERALKSSPFGVLGNHQKDWNNMGMLMYSKKAYGNKFTDIDDNTYLDLSLGDTPDMFGHGDTNPAVKAAAQVMLEDGVGTMNANEDAVVATELLAKQFGLPCWMANLSASDSNRAVLAIARQFTGRNIIAIPNFTYHGNIEETQKIKVAPGVISRVHGMNIYQTQEVNDRTRIFDYNDLESVEEVLKDEQVAVIMMEPVMSNFGWSWPHSDFNKKLYALCQKYGTLLAYDETHTLSAGPRGMVGELQLEGYYDFWTCGKAIASGIPTGVFGMREDIARELARQTAEAGLFGEAAFGQLGTLLSGNPVSAKALRVTLEQVLTDEVYDRIAVHVDEIVAGMRASIEKYNAPFSIEKMGNRISYTFLPERCYDPISASVGIAFGGLFEFSHAYMWNRDILIMPYFNMLLITPLHSREDTAKFLPVWDDFVRIAMGQ